MEPTMSLLLALSLVLTGCACDDTDADGVCDELDACEGDDALDADEDGVCDAMDLCDGDDATGDNDADGTCDGTDDDDDNAGVRAADDSDPTDPNLCGDSDADDCDDCSSGSNDPAADGTDTDADGLCDAGDADDDNDTVPDDEDIAPLDPTQCEDLDADTCDDCSNGLPDPLTDGPDTDADGLCNPGDDDDDNDGSLDVDDSSPEDPFVCSDTDADTCEDCSSGTYNPADDGPDWNGDGQCDAVDPEPEGFTESQTVLGKTVTCDSVTNTETYSECTNTLVDGLYFPNHIECGPLWSSTESPATEHGDFCAQITGSTQFEVYYTCDTRQDRVSLYGETWGVVSDNGYTESIRCYFPSKK
jgi:hypothetical protein